MKRLRIFETAELAAAILPTLEYGTLSKIRGGSGVSLNPGVVPPAPAVDITTPFFVENITQNVETVRITNAICEDSGPLNFNIEYSTDKNTWAVWGKVCATDLTMTLNPGDRVYLRAKTKSWHQVIGFDDSDAYISGMSKIGGNIMSLLYGSDFTGNETSFPQNYPNIFNGTFKYVSILMDAGNLILPATKLTEGCYEEMFYCCTSLTSVPTLPATTLVKNCYRGMFNSCPINYIKCLATNISASGCISRWVEGVAATGIFVKDPSMSGWSTGTSGIPSGWTVEDAA